MSDIREKFEEYRDSTSVNIAFRYLEQADYQSAYFELFRQGWLSRDDEITALQEAHDRLLATLEDRSLSGEDRSMASDCYYEVAEVLEVPEGGSVIETAGQMKRDRDKLQEENDRLKAASSISEFTDGLIASMFAINWTGPESEDLQLAKATLYKSLKNQTDGFWSGHTAYHIMIDGGFLFDGKSNTNKTLTPLGRQFMRDIEMEALQEQDK